jgi:glucose-6-phosphate isomerase
LKKIGKRATTGTVLSKSGGTNEVLGQKKEKKKMFNEVKHFFTLVAHIKSYGKNYF